MEQELRIGAENIDNLQFKSPIINTYLQSDAIEGVDIGTAS